MKAAKAPRPRTKASAVPASPVSAPAETERHTRNERRGLYMMWFDDSAKKPPVAKIEEAVEAYMKHFHARPNVVLVNENDRIDVSGLDVRSTSYVRRDNFWVGYEDAA